MDYLLNESNLEIQFDKVTFLFLIDLAKFMTEVLIIHVLYNLRTLSGSR